MTGSHSEECIFDNDGRPNKRCICKTKVVNLRKEPYDVYIGRAGKGKDGYFGNPVTMEVEEDRCLVLDWYRGYFYNRLKTDPEFKRQVQELKGKTLGCFCKPKACHGDVIAEYLNRL